MKLAIVMPCTDSLSVETAMSLLALQAFLITHPVDEEQQINIFVEQSSLLVQSRQNLIQRALDWEADWVLMLDSDMLFPADLLHRLARHGKPIVACNYVKRSVPTTPVTKGMDDKYIITNKESTGLQEAKFTGFGACLIAADVFRKIGKPWFDTVWLYNQEDDLYSCLGEDVFFFEKVRHFLDEILWIDHDTSKDIGHVGVFVYENNLAEVVKEELDDEELKEKLYG